MATRSPEGAGACVLDIGGNVGAVMVRLAGPTPSAEIEAQPAGNSSARFHTGVHRRDVGGETAWLAVFPEVAAGDYELLAPSGEVSTRFTVAGGQVTEIRL